MQYIAASRDGDEEGEKEREGERDIAARNGRHKPPPNGFPYIYIYTII